jgi:hypothetical protein
MKMRMEIGDTGQYLPVMWRLRQESRDGGIRDQRVECQGVDRWMEDQEVQVGLGTYYRPQYRAHPYSLHQHQAREPITAVPLLVQDSTTLAQDHSGGTCSMDDQTQVPLRLHYQYHHFLRIAIYQQQQQRGTTGDLALLHLNRIVPILAMTSRLPSWI